MDPNIVLASIREALRDMDKAMQSGDTDSHIDAMIDAVGLFEKLDTWLTKGGFLPEDWQH